MRYAVQRALLQRLPFKRRVGQGQIRARTRQLSPLAAVVADSAATVYARHTCGAGVAVQVRRA